MNKNEIVSEIDARIVALEELASSDGNLYDEDTRHRALVESMFLRDVRAALSDSAIPGVG